jgi:phage gp29-like protein
MPERSHAKNFNRKLDPAEAQILAAAGNGSKTEGFRNLLGLYQELHSLGYRFDMSIASFINSKAG